MFKHLDGTLAQLLHDKDAPKALHDAVVSFATPKQDYTVSKATLNLFLHEVKENAGMRDVEPILSWNGDHYERRCPPLRADCADLVTASSNYMCTAYGVGQHLDPLLSARRHASHV